MRGHLGDRMAALVDGELDHDERDRALVHLARCAECRLAVQQERWVKARLQSLPAGEPSAAMLSSLFATTGSPSTGSPAMLALPAATTRRGRPGLVLAGAGSVSAAMFGVAYLLGGSGPSSAPVAPTVSPPVGQFSVQLGGTTQGPPFADPAVGVVPAATVSVPLR